MTCFGEVSISAKYSKYKNQSLWVKKRRKVKQLLWLCSLWKCQCCTSNFSGPGVLNQREHKSCDYKNVSSFVQREIDWFAHTVKSPLGWRNVIPVYSFPLRHTAASASISELYVFSLSTLEPKATHQKLLEAGSLVHNPPPIVFTTVKLMNILFVSPIQKSSIFKSSVCRI